MYRRINTLIPKLQAATEVDDGDFTVDEKQRQIELTESGHEKIEELLIDKGLLEEDDSLYAATNIGLCIMSIRDCVPMSCTSVMWNTSCRRDRWCSLMSTPDGYAVGRRLSEGLHQAIEAKEGVKIQSESQTLGLDHLPGHRL